MTFADDWALKNNSLSLSLSLSLPLSHYDEASWQGSNVYSQYWIMYRDLCTAEPWGACLIQYTITWHFGAQATDRFDHAQKQLGLVPGSKSLIAWSFTAATDNKTKKRKDNDKRKGKAKKTLNEKNTPNKQRCRLHALTWQGFVSVQTPVVPKNTAVLSGR